MNTVANVPSLQMDESELISVLKESLYPGASDNSIKMAIGYCKASGLDPMQKPVHIVPMWDSNARRMRDTIMPGIGLYRIQAARSGEYGGVSAPEYGKDVKEVIGSVNITYPSTCTVTVYRITSGQRVPFTACERWIENYAIKGGTPKDISPNSMWSKRPYAQLAKCAEAQALRKAFPEFGSAPTAEEMEGKEFITHDNPPIQSDGNVITLEQYPAADFEKNYRLWSKMIKDGEKTPQDIINFLETKFILSEIQIKEIKNCGLSNNQENILEGEFNEIT